MILKNQWKAKIVYLLKDIKAQFKKIDMIDRMSIRWVYWREVDLKFSSDFYNNNKIVNIKTMKKYEFDSLIDWCEYLFQFINICHYK